ncbi:MAG: ABC transporter ATP-binding protein [Candidatus Hodarchaeales archaeon]|jgi:oligopeptide/dipeptide ABC transporter ATP-binding protein
MSNTSTNDVLVKIENLHTHFFTYAGVVKALDGVNLEIMKGETLGLVGETGCGKSVTARCIVRLVLPPGKIVDGRIFYGGRDLLQISEKQIQKIRGSRISIVFQDPATYLNPVMTIGDQLMETIRLHQDLRQEAIELEIAELKEKEEASNSTKLKKKVDKLENKLAQLKREDLKRKVKASKKYLKKVYYQNAIDILKTVRLPDPDSFLSRYPFELSGGMRQRCMIAISLSCKPDLLIADEATTALDVTIQAQVLHLLSELKDELNTSILIITHDLGVVANTCQRIIVMYAGTIAESAETIELFANPTHPYTNGLFSAIPKLSEDKEKLEIIPGIVPNLIDPPSGCRFHPRCQHMQEVCSKTKPRLSRLKKGHLVACHVFGTDDYVYDVEKAVDSLQ